MSDAEQKRVFRHNLQRYVSMSGKTQKEIADKIGVSAQTFNTWMQGIAIPRMGKVQLLADYFGIYKSDLIEDKTADPSPPDDRTYPTIPVLGTIAAGEPILMSEHEVDRIPLYPNYGEGMFALIVSGDSMAPRIQDGDMVVALAQNDVENGDIAVVAVNGDEATCKRVYKGPGTVTLVADNAAVYPPHTYGPGDDPVLILGKVVEIRAKA